MRKKFTILTKKILANTIRSVAEIPLDETHEVIIRPHKTSRSIRQNALYRTWVGLIAEYVGDTPKATHTMLKEAHLVAILARECEDVVEYIEAVKEVRRQGLIAQANILRAAALAEYGIISTTRCNTKTMAEYMTIVNVEAIDMGITLPKPDDPKDLQYGKAKKVQS